MKKVYSIAMAAVILGLGAGAASTARSAPEAPAQDEGRMSQFVEIAPNRSLYVDYIRAQPGKPTVALVNGLTYRTGPGCWENFANALKKRGIGVFMWDQRGMGQTLLREGWPEGPIDYRDQVADMRAVLDKVGLSGPQHIVGLSYGGGEAAYFAATSPERIASLTLMSPYTEPVESQDHFIKMQIAMTRAMFPYNPASDNELYDYFFRILVYSTYPAAEPIALENPYKLEAIFRMAQGIRPFRAEDVAKFLPPASTHLLIGLKDEYIPLPVLERFWREIPGAARMSKIYLEDTKHKSPEEQPELMATLVEKIVMRDPELAGGRVFSASPLTKSLREIEPIDQARREALGAKAAEATQAPAAKACNGIFLGR